MCTVDPKILTNLVTCFFAHANPVLLLYSDAAADMEQNSQRHPNLCFGGTYGL